MDRKGWASLLGAPILFLALYLWPQGSINDICLCAVKRMSGIDCPGCHMTRSLARFVRGDIAGSLGEHLLGPAVALFAIYMFARSLLWLISGRRPNELLSAKRRYQILIVFLVILFAQWVIRLLIAYNPIK